MNQTIGISGSTGYIGRLIARAFQNNGAEVVHIARDRRKVQGLFGDTAISINSELPPAMLAKLLSEHRITSVVHAATNFTHSRSIDVVAEVTSANLNFAISLFEAARQAECSFINLNSFWQLGNPREGIGPYAATKEAFRRYVQCGRPVSMRVVNLFVPETFGPHDHRGKVVGGMILARQNSQNFTVSNPKIKIDLAFAPYLANFLVQLTFLDARPTIKDIAYVNFRGVELGALSTLIATYIPDFQPEAFSGTKEFFDSPKSVNYGGIEMETSGLLGEGSLHRLVAALISESS